MSTSAIIMMVISMVIIWGGLLASIYNAVKASKTKKRLLKLNSVNESFSLKTGK